jgi:predicted RNase H-like nuclease
MREGFERLGFALATTRPTNRRKALLEVYPHPALLALLNRATRVPYKVSRSARYWPRLSRQARLDAIVAELKAIHSGLEAYFGRLPFQLPQQASRPSGLKPFEDALDALVSAWVGTLFLEEMAEPLGDDDAAIWCPRASIDPKMATVASYS